MWSLRPDGAVLRMDHEAFTHPVDEVHDPRTVHAVLADAVRHHPELRDLAPARPPPGVQPCDTSTFVPFPAIVPSGASRRA